MTTAHRAQADGQTERQNLVLEDALRCMISYHGDDWVKHLGTIEYAHSTLVNSSTPSERDTGRNVSNIVAEEMEEAQASQKEYYDRKRRQLVFQRGELVQFDTKNLPLKTVNKNPELKKAELAAKKLDRS
ncbi:hypothetical protein ON010_g5351 [Phytophthora cinnamomi]|nr:hypothetical protein ON010_g5351 [Phytophthora cinnamomi]